MSARGHGKNVVPLGNLRLNLLLTAVTFLLPSYLYLSVRCELSDPRTSELEAVDVLTNYLGTFVDGPVSRDNVPLGHRAQDGAKHDPSGSEGSWNKLTGKRSSRRARKGRIGDILERTRSLKKLHTADQPPLTGTEFSERLLANLHQTQVPIQRAPLDFDLNDPVEELKEEEYHPHGHATSQEIAHLGKAHGSRGEPSNNAGIGKTETESRLSTSELKRQFSTGGTISPPSDGHLPTLKAVLELDFPRDDILEAIGHEPIPKNGVSRVVATHIAVGGRGAAVIERMDSKGFLQKNDQRCINAKIGGAARIPTAKFSFGIDPLDSRVSLSQRSGLLPIHGSMPTLNHRPTNMPKTNYHSRTKKKPSSYDDIPRGSKQLDSSLEVVICKWPQEYKAFRAVWLPACHHKGVRRVSAIREAGTKLGENVLEEFGLTDEQQKFLSSLKTMAQTSQKNCFRNELMPTDMDRTSKMAMYKIYLILNQVFSEPLFQEYSKLKIVFEEAHRYVIGNLGLLVDQANDSKEFAQDLSASEKIDTCKSMKDKAQNHFESIAYLKLKGKKDVNNFNSLAWAIVEAWMQTKLDWAYTPMKFKGDLNQLFRVLVDDYAIANSGYIYTLDEKPAIFEFKKWFKLKKPQSIQLRESKLNSHLRNLCFDCIRG